jgi:hypothetical protein
MKKMLRRRLLLEELEDRTVPTLLGQQLFPTDYPWNQNIANAPVAGNSAAIISHIGSSIRIHPDWGDDSPANGNSPLYGMPYNVVHGNSVAKINVIIDNYPGESDLVPAPIPAGAVIEGDNQNGPNLNGGGYNSGQRGDSHLIVWDEDNAIAYELYGATRPSDPTLFPDTSGNELPHTDGRWHAAQESVWNMKTDSFRTLGDTSADAAGLSILAGLARPDEGLPVVQGGQGTITHALRFTLPSGDVNPQYLYPASHMVSTSAGSTKLPFGARLRLMNTPAVNAVISTLGPQAQIIAHAMQQYGLVLADIGSAMYVTGTSAAQDSNNNISQVWNMSDALGLSGLNAGDFEVVDLTPRVTGLSTSSAAAGSTITVIGQNFSGAAGHLSVFFGSTAAASVTFVDDAHLSVVVPGGSGTVNVTVQSGVNEIDPNNPADNVNNPVFGYGTSALVTADQFTYSSTTIGGMADPGFEIPALPVGGIQYDPPSSPWTFHGSAGVTANGSAFTGGNPSAPQGLQVAFLQGGGSASQSIAFPAGTYSIGLSAAQRANVQNGGQTFQVLIDGKVAASFNNLTGAGYRSLVTTSFTVTAGSHVIIFQGTDLHGGDNTVFLDQININQLAAGLNDSGFESVVVGNGSFQYAPAGSSWLFHGSAGLSGNGSAFTAGNPNPPQGSQVAFIQAAGNISQSATFPAGTFNLTFYAAQRGNAQVGGQTFQVLIDGRVIGTYNNLVGTTYATLATSSFTVTAGNHTLLVQGTDLHGGDNTVFLDQFVVNLLPTNLNDSGWESPALASGGIQYGSAGSAWTFSGSAGLTTNGSAFTVGNPNAPQGSQVAFIQGIASISQSVTFAAGNYDMGFFAAQRANVQNGGQTFLVLIDGTVVGTFNNLMGASYTSWVTASFSVTAGTHMLTFQGTDLHGGDNTIFLDGVALNPLP